MINANNIHKGMNVWLFFILCVIWIIFAVSFVPITIHNLAMSRAFRYLLFYGIDMFECLLILNIVYPSILWLIIGCLSLRKYQELINKRLISYYKHKIYLIIIWTPSILVVITTILFEIYLVYTFISRMNSYEWCGILIANCVYTSNSIISVILSYSISKKYRYNLQIFNYCIKCGYDLRGNTSGYCPECGSK